MSALTLAADRPKTVDGLRWWRCPAGTWLEVTMTGEHGRATDMIDAPAA